MSQERQRQGVLEMRDIMESHSVSAYAHFTAVGAQVEPVHPRASTAGDQNREIVGKRELVCEYRPHGWPCVDAGGKKGLSPRRLPEVKRGLVSGEYPKMGQASRVVNKNKLLGSRPGH